jgi:hypothetical protein
MVDTLPASYTIDDEAAFSIEAIQNVHLSGDAADSDNHNDTKDLLRDFPNQALSTKPKASSQSKSHNIFGKMVEQDTGPFILKPNELSVSEQTRFSKMIMGEGGIMIKGHNANKEDIPVAPEFANIYVPQNIEKEGATNNWDCYEAADKSSPPCDSPPAVEITKAPGIFSRLLFKKGSGEDSPEKTCELFEGAQAILDSPAYPDPQDNCLPDDFVMGDKPVRRKSFIAGAIDLLRGRNATDKLEEEEKQESKEAVFL